jgi:hypothetical protein
VEVGVEYDPGIKLKSLMLATVLERIDKDVAASRSGEDGGQATVVAVMKWA